MRADSRWTKLGLLALGATTLTYSLGWMVFMNLTIEVDNMNFGEAFVEQMPNSLVVVLLVVASFAIPAGIRHGAWRHVVKGFAFGGAVLATALTTMAIVGATS